MYDSEFQKYHQRLVDYSDDEVELQVHQRIFHDHGCKMMNFSEKDCRTPAITRGKDDHLYQCV